MILASVPFDLENTASKSKEEAVALAKKVLKGELGDALEAVAVNASAPLYLAGKAKNFSEG